MKKQLWILITVCAAALAYGQRLSPQQLQADLDGGERITLIDLRTQDAYEKGTLPDALRMSVRQALEKNLSGKVVFFDDGLGVNHARRAVDTFEKAGKVAVELAGGYAAWRATGQATSEQRGVSQILQRYVSYQDLTGALIEDAADIVLVDVRETPAPAPSRAVMALGLEGEGAVSSTRVTNTASAPLDLAAELPGYRITRQSVTPEAQGSTPRASVSASPSDAIQPLYILIDSGDGTADKKAAELRASGCARVAVLAGGEAIIRRKGEPGLVRRGPGTGLTTSEGPDKKILATINEEVSP